MEDLKIFLVLFLIFLPIMVYEWVYYDEDE